MQTEEKKPEIIVFAGPNGSGKSTITKLARVIDPYINADDIKRTIHCSDLEAALKAEELRETALSNNADFTFETVLSTERNINLLKRAEEQGYFVRCIYIFSRYSYRINSFIFTLTKCPASCISCISSTHNYIFRISTYHIIYSIYILCST